MKDLIRVMDPKYIEVTGLFTPRGGISIYPTPITVVPAHATSSWRSAVSRLTSKLYSETSSAARSLAERTRGLRSISSAEGMTGLLESGRSGALRLP